MPYDVAVIGAGVFGAWTAHRLRQAGLQVVLADAYGAANSRSSSGGESRIIRMGYGADEIYTRSAMRSLVLWQQFCQQTGQPLFHQAGVLWTAAEGDPYTANTRQTLAKCGAHFEVLSPAELKSRYPQMEFAPGAWGIFEPESGALMARRAVEAVVADAVRHGVAFLREAAAAPPRTGSLPAVGTTSGGAIPAGAGEAVVADAVRHGVAFLREAAAAPPGTGSLPAVGTTSGGTIRAGAYVFACGPWLPKLFPDLLAKRIAPTRQEAFFFGTPPGDPRFAPPAMPVWIDFSDPRGPYGFPDLENRGVKIALDQHGPPIDPDTADRVPSADSLAAARDFLGQ